MTRKTFAMRAAAILTTSEVLSTAYPLAKSTDDRSVMVEIAFTLGSLDIAGFNFYVSTSEGGTYVPLAIEGGATSLSLDATGNIAVRVDAPGYSHLKVGAIGYGTATSSSATITARYV